MPSENKSASSSQNFLIISLITVFLIISLFVLLFIYQKGDSNSTKTNQDSSASQTVGSSDWQTYTSAGYNYSIDYPADWTKSEASTSTDGTTPEIILLNLVSQNESTSTKPNIFLTAGLKELCNTTDGPKCTEVETFQVTGASVVKYTDNDNDKIYYKVGDNIWLAASPNGNEELIDQVVKTVKVN